jgi:hypothetical protein
MAPRTRSSQMGGSNIHARAAQNENQVPFQAQIHVGAPTQSQMVGVSVAGLREPELARAERGKPI